MYSTVVPTNNLGLELHIRQTKLQFELTQTGRALPLIKMPNLKF